MTLGERIRDYATEHKEDEDALSLDKLAEALGEDKRVISFVLDSFYVDNDTEEVKYVGTGAGGNWIVLPDPTEEEILQRQLDDNVITQQDYDLRMELIERGEDPRSADALQALLAEKAEDGESHRDRS